METPSQDSKLERNRLRLNANQARFRERHKERLSEKVKQQRKDKIAALPPDELAAFRTAEAEKTRRTHAANKEAVFSAYGGYVCKCCGETEPTFLSIDHVHNDGAKMRKEVHGNSSFGFYSWLRRNAFPSGYQVLCMNCQIGKYRNGGICPHSSKV